MEVMDWLFRDPLRGCRWFNQDQFPYERGRDEVEIDFIVKGGVYMLLLGVGGMVLVEGGWLVYVLWVSVNYLRRKG